MTSSQLLFVLFILAFIFLGDWLFFKKEEKGEEGDKERGDFTCSYCGKKIEKDLVRIDENRTISGDLFNGIRISHFAHKECMKSVFNGQYHGEGIVQNGQDVL